jgi:hypothetical protein
MLYFLQKGTHFLANSEVSERASKVSIAAPSLETSRYLVNRIVNSKDGNHSICSDKRRLLHRIHCTDKNIHCTAFQKAIN